MLLIADSGSTKTHWSLTDGKTVIKEVYTNGINPFYQDEAGITVELENQLLPKIRGYEIEGINFYGAGCSFPEKRAIVSRAIGRFFPGAVIEVQSDLLGAARALFGRKAGIACILGTGSNSCYYDGKEIVENVSPLGFILGDEGSGAVLVKSLVADCLKNQLPASICDKFMKQYKLTPAMIMEHVYKKPFPNRFLAQFAPFLSENIDKKQIYDIVYQGFKNFFKRNIAQYKKANEIGFIGSVAWHLSDVLKKVAAEEQISITQIVQSPMEGLLLYHSK
jgi:N-acetylglucosamine kinase-like BadF-type ATPase